MILHRHAPFVLLSAALLLAGCVAPSAPPPPPPPPPAPAPPPPAVAPPPVADWRDRPLTPGTWRYVPAAGGSEARFGTGAAPPGLTLRCEAAAASVRFVVVGATAPGAMRVTTTSGVRTIPLTASGAGVAGTLSARDPFLDQMAFSRGRFAVTLTGLPMLVLPAWPEVSRVIEDCRAGPVPVPRLSD